MTERETQLQGLATEWRTMAYTWRDCALYALAVGATGEEPQYTYEKDMQVIPTFGVLPYWGAVNVTPQFPRPRAVPVLVEELLPVRLPMDAISVSLLLIRNLVSGPFFH